jgi:hypothetical protein
VTKFSGLEHALGRFYGDGWIALRRPAFGYRRLGYFLRRDGLRVNHKRLLPAIRPNERRSIDFVADQLGSGERFRVLTITDDYTRQWPATIVDTSISGTRVVRATTATIFNQESHTPGGSKLRSRSERLTA